MTKRKKHSMMVSEIKSVRREQLSGAPEAQRLAWPGVQFPGNRIQLFLSKATQVAALGQVLPQQAVGVLVDAALPRAVRIGEGDLDPGGFRQLLTRLSARAMRSVVFFGIPHLNSIEHMAEALDRR